ncbi:quinone-dependent dihydroorotate dehydrogenase [Xanthobacter dioxanivorans]|uniref:Dihydroorotate dehydrogenase (quinone) n=1 Tax=Xanthobacter dioxanivorans TaxID=2528964 RepID=A0A974PQS8_9HYPH|nr:quinone-dependent dihydroorotate dehydrogenase [Xanthobacter dioxanivorans]QRG07653.1 quinone-dependent dihydroorotate dehydrogenase [Xanthobacter dioxanivorans]
MDVYALVRPFFRFVSPERAHGLAVRALKTGLVPELSGPDDPVLATRVWGIAFPNPVGLAAGFDKHCEVADQVMRLGFGFVEAGTVTPRPQPGNPMPRLFRLDEDEAVINRFGFNSEGLAPFVYRLGKRRSAGATGIVGANVGKNKESEDTLEDYAAGVSATCRLADYVVCNVSSPNTPGLRALQARSEMEALLAHLIAVRNASIPDPAGRPPLLVKVAPDLDDAALADVAEVALRTGVDGIVMGNTTLSRPASLRSGHRSEAGGLSGKPLMALSTERLAALSRLVGGRLPLIGAGGIGSGADAYAKIRAGASLVQLYSALVFHGPGLVGRIKADLAARLKADGFAAVADAVGADVR